MSRTPLPAGTLRLELNNSGAWKLIGFVTPAAAYQVADTIAALGKALDSSTVWRLVTDSDRLLQAEWTRSDGWRFASSWSTFEGR